MSLSRRAKGAEKAEVLIDWWDAEAIHGYFVAISPTGVKNCEANKVTKANLNALLALCELVMKKYFEGDDEFLRCAKRFLPTPDGVYDSWYIRELGYTIAELKKLLDDWDNIVAPDDELTYLADFFGDRELL